MMIYYDENDEFIKKKKFQHAAAKNVDSSSRH